mmetsp:Transcript_21396/g.25768  ORF Transcript_21396/g.25768 Transcript_21396/m.25768 type:complete len:99 (+) Transcript_21396:129-425(+)
MGTLMFRPPEVRNGQRMRKQKCPPLLWSPHLQALTPKDLPAQQQNTHHNLTALGAPQALLALDLMVPAAQENQMLPNLMIKEALTDKCVTKAALGSQW